MEWLWIAVGWLFLNVIVKLLVNSFERIYKDRINDILLKTPGFLVFSLVEALRILFILFFLPTITLVSIFPNRVEWQSIQEIKSTFDFILSKRRFHRVSPLMFYLFLHPLALFSRTRQEEVRRMWLRRVSNDPKLLDKYGNLDRLTGDRHEPDS